MTIESLLLNAATTKLRQSTERIAICLGKLTDDQIWSRGNENENAVGNLVLHLEGNVRQWMISGLGGQPDVRQRDLEFSTDGGMSREALAEKIRETVEEAVAILPGLTAEDLTGTYHAQNRTASGVDVIMNVVEHFGQHTGQIIFATKNLTGEDLGLVMPRKKTPQA